MGELILLCLHPRRIKSIANQKKQMAGVTVLSRLFCSSLLRTVRGMRFACAGKEKNVGTALQLQLYILSSTFASLQFCAMGLSTKASS